MASAFDRFYDKVVTVSGRCLHPDSRDQVAFQFDAPAMVNPLGAADALSGSSVSPGDFTFEVCVQLDKWALHVPPQKGFKVRLDNGVYLTVNDYTADDFHFCMNCKGRVENR